MTDQEKRFSEARVPAYPLDQKRFLGGYGTVRPPLAGVYSLGSDLYLPIPYAKHCKVTYDKPGKCYYRIECRTYPSSTQVETFTLASLQEAGPSIERAGAALSQAASDAGAASRRLPAQTRTLSPGESLTATMTGCAALQRLAVRLRAADLSQALRSTVLSLTFDGVQTAWCPVGDFFGSGIGLHVCRDWMRDVEGDGTLRCDWIMPFKGSCKIDLQNLGSQPVEATLAEAGFEDWSWDDRSMYFHAGWHAQYPIQTRANEGTMDWNYLEAAGQGVYVGDTLIIHNGGTDWWGEGDEKIYVDGESFPSHFGNRHGGITMGIPAGASPASHFNPRS